MATQDILIDVSENAKTPDVIPATISLGTGFHISPVDDKIGPQQLQKTTTVAAAIPAQPPLGVLSNFTGTFAGTGFNTIFRPNNGTARNTKFPKPVNPPPPAIPNETVLQLNLTTETLTFTDPIGKIPNRGLGTQGDIFLNGVSYVQSINDVTNQATGKADGTPNGIHFEPGLWIHVPATDNDPVLGDSLVRMASIPHGTTINAQGLTAPITINGLPTIPAVDITPFPIGVPGKRIHFASQDVNEEVTARIPQDLSKFASAGTITQEILTDPNTVLRNANKGKNITKTTVFTVSTNPEIAGLGGGTANIAFLVGTPNPPANTPTPKGLQIGPNASAVLMTSTFWISTIQQTLTIPPYKPGSAPLRISPVPSAPGTKVPTWLVKPPYELKTEKNITVVYTQIQYSQLVNLDFGGLSWPHVSVATLIPSTDLQVPSWAWN